MADMAPSDREAALAQLLTTVDDYYARFLATRPFAPGETTVPVTGKTYDAHELRQLVEASLDCWWTEGRFAQEAQHRLEEFLGVKYALLCNSGSSANLLAFAALTSPALGDRRIRPGDEVIGVAAGFPTTLTPIIQNGCVPVLLDIEIGTYNIDVRKLDEAITPKTRAIMLAHTLGNPWNVAAVMDVARRHNLWVIEDCCDALGATYDGKKVGTFGDIGTLSFYPAHQITAGEGGAVFTDNALLKRILASLRDWGRDCWCAPGQDNTCGKRFLWQIGKLPFGYDHKYTYSHAGYNLKLTDMQAALLLAQIDKLPSFIEKRRRNFALLSKELARYGRWLILPQATPRSDPSWFGFLITVRDDAGFTKNDLVAHLESSKVATRMLFAGNITKQPMFEGVKHRVVGDLRNTDTAMRNAFWIGVWPGITDEMYAHVLKTFAEFFASLTAAHI